MRDPACRAPWRPQGGCGAPGCGFDKGLGQRRATKGRSGALYEPTSGAPLRRSRFACPPSLAQQGSRRGLRRLDAAFKGDSRLATPAAELTCLGRRWMAPSFRLGKPSRSGRRAFLQRREKVTSSLCRPSLSPLLVDPACPGTAATAGRLWCSGIRIRQRAWTKKGDKGGSQLASCIPFPTRLRPQTSGFSLHPSALNSTDPTVHRNPVCTTRYDRVASPP